MQGDVHIKKLFSIGLILSLTLVMLVGCMNASEIRKLEEEIENYEYKLEDYEDELEDWQDIYDDALSTYNRYSYSSDYAIQKELEKTKDMMDKAKREIVGIQRNIDLTETFLEQAKDSLERLKKDN